MKRFIVLSLILIFVGIGYAADLPTNNAGNSAPQSSSILHFSNWTSTGTGTAFNGTAGVVFYRHRWVIDLGGTIPDNLNAKLKGKDDYANWFTLDTYSTLTPDALETRWVHNKGASSFRVDIDTFLNGSTITINSVHGGE